MFRECSGFDITPQEVLIICLLNTIQDKTMMVKVQEQMTENITWKEVRNIIIKINNASRLYKGGNCTIIKNRGPNRMSPLQEHGAPFEESEV